MTNPARTCEQCGAALSGQRRHARYCGPVCRSAASRERARSGSADWNAFVDAISRANPRKRTVRFVRGDRNRAAAVQRANRGAR
jgi:hypothetical protein